MIIGIIGKKHSGKTTTSNYLKDHLIGVTDQINFADSLKWEVCNACGIGLPFLEQNKENFRLIMQGWGTDFRRRLYGDDYWIKQVEKVINNGAADNYIIADVRFLNEAEMIKRMNGVLVRVHRTLSNKHDLHPSETEMEKIKFDYSILNIRDLKHLENEVRLLAGELKHD